MTATPPTPASETGPFRAPVVIGLILVCIISLVALAGLSAFQPELRGGDDGQEHALSKSAVGYAAALQLLHDTGREATASRIDPKRDDSYGMLVLTPPPGREDRALADAINHDRSVLIVLPKWSTAPDALHRGWVRKITEYPAEASLSALPPDLRKGVTLHAAQGTAAHSLLIAGNEVLAKSAPVEGLRTLEGEGWIPVIMDETGRSIVLTHEESGVYVLADPDLINTQGMNNPVKAAAALAIFDYLSEDPAIFDLTMHGFGGSQSVLRLMFTPPWLGFTLCFAFAVALIGWQAAIRFAPHRHAGRAVALGKQALADNTAALVKLARREHRMAKPYAELVRTQTGKAVAAPPGLSREGLTTLLDRLAKRQGLEPIQQLEAQAEAAKTSGDLMTVARSLTRWKQEMTRGRD